MNFACFTQLTIADMCGNTITKQTNGHAGNPGKCTISLYVTMKMGLSGLLYLDVRGYCVERTNMLCIMLI